MGLLALGLFASRRAKEKHRRQIELARQVVDDAQRRLPVIVEKPAMGAQHAKLQGETAFVIGAAATAHLPQIDRRQAPMLREFILARVAGDGGAAADGHPDGSVRGRH